jgi:TolB-like protein
VIVNHTLRVSILALTVLPLWLPACSGPSKFVDPEADMPFYAVVGVMPFNSLAQDGAAGLRVANVFFTELLERHFAQVVEPGQFQASIREVRGGLPMDAPWSTQDLAKLGEKAGVQGVFQGTVREYGIVQQGRDAVPVLSLEIHLIDANTGRVVWSASKTAHGSAGVPILGFGKMHTMGELTSEVCRELLSTLPKG